ncbi:MAG: TrkH family potassium uptake protein [Bacteroides sp.]
MRGGIYTFRPHVVMRYVGLIVLENAFFMFVCLCVAFFERDSGLIPLLFSALITMLVGIFPFVFVKAEPIISNREGYAIVVFSWLAACFFGMIPYVLWGGEFNLSGAWFESVSGFTTTGATILDDVEALPPSLLLWRSITHWFGGMGVVVFTLVVLPSMGSAQMTLSRTEVSSIARKDFKYRNKKMLRAMATSYLGITMLVAGALVLVEIPIFDAINLAFSTVSTGGFSVTNLSVATYSNPAAEWILTAGMFIASLHFGLLFSLFSQRWKSVFQSPVVHVFSGVVFASTLAIFFALLFQSNLPAGVALRAAAFQVVSIISTTGFASIETLLWPQITFLILILLSISGGCSGSTAGGMKIDRIAIITATIRSLFLKQKHPQAVIPIHIGKVHIEEQIAKNTAIYMILHLTIIVLATAYYSLASTPLAESFTISLSMMSNVGPAIGTISSYGSYSFLSHVARLVATLLMLLGRLEIFGLLLIFAPSSWK